MWDDIQEIGSAFNWITPGFAFLQDLLAGPVVHFGVPALSAWDKRSIKRLLARTGVQSWGYQYTLDMETLSFSVRKPDVQQAYFRLKEEGVPMSSIPAGAVPPEHRRGWFE